MSSSGLRRACMYPTPLVSGRMWHKVKFSAEFNRFEVRFPSFRPVVIPKLKSPICLIIYLWLWWKEMDLCLSREHEWNANSLVQVWTISYDDNRHADSCKRLNFNGSCRNLVGWPKNKIGYRVKSYTCVANSVKPNKFQVTPKAPAPARSLKLSNEESVHFRIGDHLLTVGAVSNLYSWLNIAYHPASET